MVRVLEAAAGPRLFLPVKRKFTMLFKAMTFNPFLALTILLATRIKHLCQKHKNPLAHSMLY
jgi:hypothetical protein